MRYIEIKARKVIDGTLAQKIIDKGNVSAVLTTGKITQPAKNKCDQADVAWSENIEERQFLESEAEELE
jgi:hypothetical protein